MSFALRASRAPAVLAAGARVLVETRAGAMLTGEILSDYAPGFGFDFQPDVGNPIYLPASRLRYLEALGVADQRQLLN